MRSACACCGETNRAAPGAEFAVHGWLDERGRGADEYAPNAPEHRRYLDYYAEMGMAADQASAFYAMTNSVPFEDALWLNGAEMAGWLGLDAALPLPPQPVAPKTRTQPQLAYLDLGNLLP